MPRQARLDAPGTLHHIIIRGIERRRIVDDNRDRDNFVDRLGKVAFETGTSFYAWALMTNHAHFLVRSGADGIAKLMRQFLTGYAISYNRRHKRHGHLFQNRYKSIVCDENKYFAELVRYIHLNPLRAGLINNLSELDGYQYCGHRVIMGNGTHPWQDRDYVLNRFGNKEGEAKRAYREFVKKGMSEGRRPDLVGGGLIRSLGGWSEVMSMRRKGDKKLTDERILGSGDFVKLVLDEADERFKNCFVSTGERAEKIKEIIGRICKKEGINISEMKSGGRRRSVSEARFQIARKLIEDYGISYAEVARNVGVTTPAVFSMLKRGK